MKIIKFGGKSLATGQGLNNTITIIKEKVKSNEEFVVVVSARANTTAEIEELLRLAENRLPFQDTFEKFKTGQVIPNLAHNNKEEFQLLSEILNGVSQLRDVSSKVRALALAQGELIAAKTVANLLVNEGLNARFTDSRQFLKTEGDYEDAIIIENESRELTNAFFKQVPLKTVSIVTGFIASNTKNETVTLGKNGSNYSAALIASYLKAEELQNYTHVDGVYTANPDLVGDARLLTDLSYQEANELINFGASILHAKTIVPLIASAIPIRILNTFNPESKGTLIHKGGFDGIKSISVQNEVSVINIEGKGLLGKSGIDGRIFKALEAKGISIGVISQGSSERGISFIINNNQTEPAINALKFEFKNELLNNDISTIAALQEVAVVTIIGQHLNGFANAYAQLIKNKVKILLINNTLSGKNISLVINKKDANKAVNVIHSEIFGVAKCINIAVFGKGTVGGAFIDQLVANTNQILKRKEIRLTIFAVVGSKKVLLNKKGVGTNWRELFEATTIQDNSPQHIIDFASANHLENLVAIDNTSSPEFVANYVTLIANGFDLISSNKIANTIDYGFYNELRQSLKTHKKKYLYETNVGAGLPLIDTIKLLHDSGENITKIKGVFSGSLSYLFNHFSVEDKPFDEILQSAIDSGFTEPDPREDLCGNDVARKLLILARELDLENEFDEIEIQNLIPEALRELSATEFLGNLSALNTPYKAIKNEQSKNHVLRYVGELSGDLKKRKGILTVKLVSIPQSSALGQVKGSDSIFEIYTDSYGDKPLVIQGAGAGAAVTARGVFGDLLRIAEHR